MWFGFDGLNLQHSREASCRTIADQTVRLVVPEHTGVNPLMYEGQ